MAGSNRKLIILQDRDMRLLRELSVMRVVDREQAKIVAGFGSTTRANARLLALTQGQFLHRFFWGSVGGARKALYSLSPRGAEAAGVPYRRPRRGQGQILAIDSLTAHQLTINEIYCALKYPPASAAAAQFVRWASFQEPIAGTVLIPDGYAEVQSSGKILSLFFEIDMGSEGRKVWEGKVRAYLSFAASGRHAEQFHQPQFRVSVVTPSDARLRAVRGATAAITDKIFRFTTLERIRHEGFRTAIWLRPVGDNPEALL